MKCWDPIPIHAVSNSMRMESLDVLLQKISKLPGFLTVTVKLKSHQHQFEVDTSTAA